MKTFSVSLFLLTFLFLFSSCNVRNPGNNDSESGNNNMNVPDTGFTGIKQFMSGKYLVSEVTFKNGVMEGLKKTFYPSGKLRQTSWYENGLREDSSKWFYEEGQLFRSTPYKRDTVDGTQIQYYRNGRIKAKLNYKKGLRTPFLEEYTKTGVLINDYPEVIVATKDNYQSNGNYSVSLSLSDKSTKVKFYRGDLTDGVFDTTRYTIIKTIKGTGTLDLKKTGLPKSDYVGVIAVVLTNFGNNNLVYKKVELPYPDLN
jgi:antitoxin component YwqK of YwqJK toxin-antitoxin module